MPSLLAVPGLLERTTPEFRSKLWRLCADRGWDADSLAAVISAESGFQANAKNPSSTASGLIQMIETTAKAVGVPGGAAGFRALSAVDQLPYVARFYEMQFGDRDPKKLRPVDYYLAVWGSGIGQPMGYVCASQNEPKVYANGTHNRYTLNAGLDVNHDGKITVEDLAAHVERQKAKAQGRRVEVVDAPLVRPPAAPPESSSSAQRLESFSSLCACLPVLDASRAELAQLPDAHRATFRFMLAELQRDLARTKHYAGRIDGQIGPLTWRALLERYVREA